MAQIIPSITSLPLDSSAAPSVEDIQDRLPSICVDYLSHDWSEEDVWASWRNMTRHKHEIANGVRLENASWRTWQKQRNHLKTISPETLNWLKDSDVTWLYGPLHTAQVEPVRPLKVASTVERLGIDRPQVTLGPAKKPILKHRTLSEMLTIPMPASPILESYGGGDEDVDILDEGRPSLIQTKSDTNIIRSRSGMAGGTRRKSPSRAPISGKNTPHDGDQTPVTGDAEHSANTGKKHISFNTFVEQCMAIDDPSDLPAIDSEEDEMLEMRSSSSRSSRPSLPRTSSSGSNASEHLTIAKIAPTMLKTQAFSNSEQLPPMIYQPPPEYLSPVNNFDATPSPGGDWGDDNASAYDYFGGPKQLQSQSPGSDTSPRIQTVPIQQGYRTQAPTVGQPPVQPKWRQGAAGPRDQSSGGAGSPGQSASPSVQSSSIDSSTSSSSASLSQSTSPQNSTSAAPARSILKVRAPGPTPPEPSSPPSNYFNYTPSAATGIGGMRGQYIDPVAAESGGGAAGSGAGLASSPLISPASEERGRRTSRDRGGSAAFDRSSSRGTTSSNTSATSISPGGVGAGGSNRSPVSTSRKPQPPPSPSASQRGRQQVSAQAQSQTQAPTAYKDQHVENVPESQQGRRDASEDSDRMDVDADDDGADIPDRATSTPTPHSSPQISFRPLKDTSPASLPHHSTSGYHPTLSASASSSSISSTLQPTSPTWPRADPPTTSTSTSTSSSGSGSATTASVPTQARPTIQNNRSVSDSDSLPRPPSQAVQHTERVAAGRTGAGSAFARLHAQGQGQRQVSGDTANGEIGAYPYAGGGDDEGDGSSIMGRAANIANTAKDLLGALWYGAQSQGPGQGQGQDGAQGPGQGPGQAKSRTHKRGASLG